MRICGADMVRGLPPAINLDTLLERRILTILVIVVFVTPTIRMITEFKATIFWSNCAGSNLWNSW